MYTLPALKTALVIVTSFAKYMYMLYCVSMYCFHAYFMTFLFMYLVSDDNELVTTYDYSTSV